MRTFVEKFFNRLAKLLADLEEKDMTQKSYTKILGNLLNLFYWLRDHLS